VTTAPFPAFPTICQAQFMALMTRASASAHHRNHFRKPLHACAGGWRGSASYKAYGDSAIVTGADRLEGAPSWRRICAPRSAGDRGARRPRETTINRVYHLDRGFERWSSNCALRAQIER